MNQTISKATAQDILSISDKMEMYALDKMIRSLKILLVIVSPLMLISSIYLKITIA